MTQKSDRIAFFLYLIIIYMTSHKLKHTEKTLKKKNINETHPCGLSGPRFTLCLTFGFHLCVLRMGRQSRWLGCVTPATGRFMGVVWAQPTRKSCAEVKPQPKFLHWKCFNLKESIYHNLICSVIQWTMEAVNPIFECHMPALAVVLPPSELKYNNNNKVSSFEVCD